MLQKSWFTCAADANQALWGHYLKNNNCNNQGSESSAKVTRNHKKYWQFALFILSWFLGDWNFLMIKCRYMSKALLNSGSNIFYSLMVTGYILRMTRIWFGFNYSVLKMTLFGRGVDEPATAADVGNSWRTIQVYKWHQGHSGQVKFHILTGFNRPDFGRSL